MGSRRARAPRTRGSRPGLSLRARGQRGRRRGAGRGHRAAAAEAAMRAPAPQLGSGLPGSAWSERRAGGNRLSSFEAQASLEEEGREGRGALSVPTGRESQRAGVRSQERQSLRLPARGLARELPRRSQPWPGLAASRFRGAGRSLAAGRPVAADLVLREAPAEGEGGWPDGREPQAPA